jgi:hypothetical protein
MPNCIECTAERNRVCHACNLALGLLGDDAERILRAAKYIQDHSSEEERRDDDAIDMLPSIERG